MIVLREAAACAAVLLLLYACGIYVRLVWTGHILPTLSTWILISFAVWTSYLTYDASATAKDWATNIGNQVDLFTTTAILLAALFCGGQGRFKFKTFDLWCLAAAVLILIGWRISGWHVSSNLAIQFVMVIAYLPTFNTLARAQTSTESLRTWVPVFIATICAGVPAVMDLNWLAIVYVGRGLACTSITIYLIRRLQ